MRNNSIFSLVIIVIIAFLLRSWNLDKPEGLWNDEYVGWYIASRQDIWSFFTDMVRNCHTPFYYLYLKVWMYLFGDTDIALRYSSLIPSVISVAVMFFAGREFKNQKFGLFCAFITAISSFLIYFAQEMRLYSLIFLMTSLSLYMTIKVLKKPNKRDMILLILSLMAIVCTHTLGIIYVFYNILFTSLYMYTRMHPKKRAKLIYILSIFVFLPISLIIILISPFLYNIATSSSLSQFWTGFSYSKVILSFTDYFSPVQTNIVNTPDTISALIFNRNQINYSFIIFAVFPSLIAFFAIIRAFFSQNNKIKYIFLTAFMFFSTLLVFSYSGKMVLITKYSIEMYPALILCFCFGLYIVKNKYLKNTLIIVFILLNILYLLFSADSAPKRTRPEGNLAPVELIRNSRLKSNDFILLTYYDKDKFERYLTPKDKYRFHSINKFNFNYFLYDNSNYFQVIKEGKSLYKDSFKEFPNKKITDYTKYTFKNNMKRGDRIGIIFLNNVSFLSNDNIQNIIKDNKQYKKTPFIFLVFSSLRNNLLVSFKNDYKIDSITQAGDWTLFVFEKTN